MDYPFSILNDPLESMTLKTFPDWACRIIWIIELSVKLPICHFILIWSSWDHGQPEQSFDGQWHCWRHSLENSKKEDSTAACSAACGCSIVNSFLSFSVSTNKIPHFVEFYLLKFVNGTQTLVTKVPFWNQVGSFGWNMALFVNQRQTCCSLNSIR